MVRGKQGKILSVKEINTKNILNIIRRHGPISRIEIADMIGLTPATVTNITAELIDKNLVAEGETGDSNGGRRPIMLKIRTDYYRVIGIYIGSRKIMIITSDLMANIKHKKEIKYNKKQVSMEDIDRIMEEELTPIIQKYNLKKKKILGIGIGIHGIVDSKHGVSVVAPNLGWKNVEISKIVHEKYDIPVFVDNNTRTMALGENWFGTGKNVSSFFCLNIDYGVGGSFFINDKPLSGASFGAGEIGHTTVDINGELCSCGNRGCLETVASVKALLKQAFYRYPENKMSKIYNGREINSVDDIMPEDLYEAAKQGDELAIELIKNMGENIGIGIANIINILNPELIIINGEIISTGEILLKPIIETVKKRGFANSVNSTGIVLSKLGNVAYLKGAVVLATQYVFDNPELICK